MIKTILDWTERRGNWWPFLAGFLATLAVLAAMGASSWLWLPAAAGIVMAVLRPVGTTLRYRRLIREAGRLRRELTTAAATLATFSQLDRLLDRLQAMLRSRGEP